MTAFGILSYVRKKYKYPAGCIWPRQGSKAKHPNVSRSPPSVRNRDHLRSWVSTSMQNVPKHGPGPRSPTSLRLIAGFCERKMTDCMFENHFMFPLTLGAGKGHAAASGRRGAEGALVVFCLQSPGFALAPLGLFLCLLAPSGWPRSAWSIASLPRQHVAHRLARAAPSLLRIPSDRRDKKQEKRRLEKRKMSS